MEQALLVELSRLVALVEVEQSMAALLVAVVEQNSLVFLQVYMYPWEVVVEHVFSTRDIRQRGRGQHHRYIQ